MNLFLAGWNLPRQSVEPAVAQLRELSAIYPQVDTATLWHRAAPIDRKASDQSDAPVMLLATMQHAPQVVGPRVYRHEQDDVVVTYDGAPCSQDGELAAHDSAALVQHWQTLPDNLEGQFVMLRADFEHRKLEVFVDPMGLYPLFYTQWQGGWLVSNNLRLLSRITGNVALDPQGVSMYLTMGWCGGNTSLLADINVFNGGEYVTCDAEKNTPTHHTYWTLADLDHTNRRAFKQREGEAFAGYLRDICASFARGCPAMEAHLSGGLDTRLLLAVLEAADVDTTYLTDGQRESEDVQIAIDVARRTGVAHQINEIPPGDVTRLWDEASWRVISQTDALTSLWQVTEVLRQPQSVTTLPGIVAGLAAPDHPLYMDNYHMARGRSVDIVSDMLAQRFDRPYAGLIGSEARKVAGDHARSFVTRWTDRGFTPFEIPEVFFADERNRRWGGGNQRKYAPQGVAFLPLATRGSLQAAFKTKSILHLVRAVHYSTLKFLSPELNAAPHNSRWQRQSEMLTWYKVYRDCVGMRFNKKKNKKPKLKDNGLFDRGRWLREVGGKLADVCLSRDDSLIWQLADRDRLEQMLTGKVDQREIDQGRIGIFNLATIRYFEESLHGAAA